MHAQQTAFEPFPVHRSPHRHRPADAGGIRPTGLCLALGPRLHRDSPSQGRARSPLISHASWEMGLCSSHYLLFIDKAATLDSSLKRIHHVVLPRSARSREERGQELRRSPGAGTGTLTQPGSTTTRGRCRAHPTPRSAERAQSEEQPTLPLGIKKNVLSLCRAKPESLEHAKCFI